MTTLAPKLISPRIDGHAAIADLRETGAMLHQRGWSLGTSSNYSVLLQREPFRLLITASGRDKSRLAAGDFVEVDEHGQPPHPDDPRPSAETLLHLVILKHRPAGAVLHTHSVWGTLLSDLYFPQRGFEIAGYEMLKGLAGVSTHEHSFEIDIFDNTQDLHELADRVRLRLVDNADPLEHGFLIRGHGLYTWGKDLAEARRHVEVLEFLFEVIGRRKQWND